MSCPSGGSEAAKSMSAVRYDFPKSEEASPETVKIAAAEDIHLTKQPVDRRREGGPRRRSATMQRQEEGRREQW